MATLITALVVVAIVLAAIDIVRSRGLSLVAWSAAVGFVALLLIRLDLK